MTENNISEDMPGDNFNRSEKEIADAARKLINRYERLLDKHDRTIEQIHETIIAFGRLLLEGSAMYGPGTHFGDWIKRRRLNTGTIAKDQPERTACMLIAKLHDVGVELLSDDDDDGTTRPARLDLTGCKNTTPTDIMKWARKHQRHIFPHLPPLGAKSVIKLANGNRHDLRALLDRVLREVDDLPASLRAAIEEAVRSGV